LIAPRQQRAGAETSLAGIGSYYHGESGRVVAKRWIIDDAGVRLGLQLANDPHTEWTSAPGTDLVIDPSIGVDDEVIYVRLSQATGVWVRNGEHLCPELDAAWERVLATESRDRRRASLHATLETLLRVFPQALSCRIRNLFFRLLLMPSGTPVYGAGPGQRISHHRPAAAEAPTFFLSYSSTDVLMAYLLYQNLKEEAGVRVWFDISKGAEVPAHQAEIERWLEQSVGGSQGFVVVLTQASIDSEWVPREITWARHRAITDPNFNLIIFKLEDVELPKALEGAANVLDCRGMTWHSAVHEELFALMYRRPGRKQWIEHHRQRGCKLPREDGLTRPDAGIRLSGELGIARRFEHTFEPQRIQWTLDYERNDGTAGSLNDETGIGIVDLGIRPGDRIAHYLIYGWRRYLLPLPVGLWMRHGFQGLTPQSVLEEYSRALEAVRRKSG